MTVSAKHSDVNVQKRSCAECFLIEKCSYFSLKLKKQHTLKPKCNCQRKSMQEKESVMVVRVELKIPSLGMPDSYPRDRIFNPNLTTIEDSYKKNG